MALPKADKKRAAAANDTPTQEKKKYEFRFRFFGRFVFAQHADTLDELEVWAINMTHNPDVPSQPHRPVLTAPRGFTARAGSIVPDLKVMALTCLPDDQSKDRLEHCIWNIDGYDITVMARGGFEWTNKDVLLDFEKLTVGNTPVTTLNALEAQKSPISSRVLFNAGRGYAQSLFGHAVLMVRLCDTPISDEERENRAGEVIRPADLVEVTLHVDQPLLILRFTRRDGDGPASSIALQAEETGDDVPIPTVANFSNVCRGSDDAPVDEEFAGMYEVLIDRPITRERLVPFHLDGLGGPDDCFVSAYLKYKK